MFRYYIILAPDQGKGGKKKGKGPKEGKGPNKKDSDDSDSEPESSDDEEKVEEPKKKKKQKESKKSKVISFPRWCTWSFSFNNTSQSECKPQASI